MPQPKVSIAGGTSGNKAEVTADGLLKVDVAGATMSTGDIEVNSEFPAAAEITDNFSNPTTTSVMSMLMGYDGGNWDRLVIGAGTEAAALRVTLANDSTGTLTVDNTVLTSLNNAINSNRVDVNIAAGGFNGTVDCNGTDVTVDNAIGAAVYARITDGSGVAAVNGANELSVSIDNIGVGATFAAPLVTKQIASATATNGKVSILDSSTEICSAGATRLSYTIVNDSDQVIYISIEDAAVLNEGIRLNPNGGSFSDEFATDAVFGICAVSGKNVTVCQQFIA